jgi:septum formation protein
MCMKSDYPLEIVLASASRSRAALLANAGIDVLIEAAHIDESLVKDNALRTQSSVDTVAALLACKKAKKISKIHPDALVIGADQMLDCDGKWLDKPDSLVSAGETLRLLRGREHKLITSVSVVHQGKEIWAFTDRADLLMRDFSDNFLNAYLSSVGNDVMLSVGAYQLEGIGAQLFERVDGDYFTILGLPIIPLLAFLREKNVIDQ